MAKSPFSVDWKDREAVIAYAKTFPGHHSVLESNHPARGLFYGICPSNQEFDCIKNNREKHGITSKVIFRSRGEVRQDILYGRYDLNINTRHVLAFFEQRANPNSQGIEYYLGSRKVACSGSGKACIYDKGIADLFNMIGEIPRP